MDVEKKMLQTEVSTRKAAPAKLVQDAVLYENYFIISFLYKAVINYSANQTHGYIRAKLLYNAILPYCIIIIQRAL